MRPLVSRTDHRDRDEKVEKAQTETFENPSFGHCHALLLAVGEDKPLMYRSETATSIFQQSFLGCLQIRFWNSFADTVCVSAWTRFPNVYRIHDRSRLASIQSCIPERTAVLCT
jgi:hypothetical protein